MSFTDTYSDTYSDFYGSAMDVGAGAGRTREGWLWYGPDGSVFDLTQYTDGIETTQGMTGLYGPNVVVNRVVRPGLPGAFTTDVRHDIAEVMLPLHASQLSRWELQQLLSSFAISTDPTNGEGQLVHVRLDGSTRTLVCRFVGGLSAAGNGSNGPAASMLPCVFQADDPYWQGEVKGTSFIGGALPSWFNMGSTHVWTPIPLGSSSVLGNVVVTNTGSKEAYPVWTVIGPGDSLRIENTDTGEAFGFSGVPLSAGQTIKIDTAAKTVRDGSGANWFSYLTEYSLWPLLSGDNHLSITLNGSTTASYVSAYWRERHLTA